MTVKDCTTLRNLAENGNVQPLLDNFAKQDWRTQNNSVLEKLLSVVHLVPESMLTKDAIVSELISRELLSEQEL